MITLRGRGNKVKIGIDISILCNKCDGIGFYTVKVLETLEKYTEHEFYLYSNHPVKLNLELNENFILRSSNKQRHINWLLFELQKDIERDEIDVFWQPNYLLPFKLKKTKQIITVHDLSGYLCPRYVDKKTIIKQRLLLKKSCKFADLIITDSEFSKKEIEEHLCKQENKINTVYLSLINTSSNNIEYADNSSKNIELLFNTNNIENGEFFLFVGTLAPRKNDKVMIDAFKRYMDLGGKKKFVVAGSVSKKSQNLVNQIEQKYKERIVFLGYVDEIVKREIYKKSFCVLYPSRLEGFGIPILEAMSYSKPVITCNNSSLPEVAGKAGLYMNNIDDDKELCELMFEIENMSNINIMEMKSQGIKQVEYFENLDFPQVITNFLLETYR